MTDYEKAIAFARKFERLEEDLVRDKCPECGKEYEGRRGIKAHLEQSECGDVTEDSSSAYYVGKRQIYDQIAAQTPHGWRTVSNLVKIGQLPEELQIFVKTPDERTEYGRGANS